MRFMIFQA